MLAISDYLFDAKAPVEMLLNCHDSISFQFDEDARPVYDECRRIMADFSSEQARIKLDLPVKVDDGEGKNWALATYGED
jgi:DNA polymerase I-like protein with 3'-5' exonuclease and polymerase domains